MTDELDIKDAHDNLTRAISDYAQANTPGAVLDHYIVVYDVMLTDADSESGINYQEYYTTDEICSISHAVGMLTLTRERIMHGEDE